MKRILIVGGASGIGLAIAVEMARRDDCERVYVADRSPFPEDCLNEKIDARLFDLTSPDYSFFDRYTDIDALMITAGFGRLALFGDLDEDYIERSFQVNTVSAIRLIRRFYSRLQAAQPFRCGVMVSIAGYMSSPFLSVYAGTKAALRVFIESVNVELQKGGSSNRILNVSPGTIRGTKFDDPLAENQLSLTHPLACDIIARLEAGDDLFIPDYERVYKHVLQRYHDDFRAEGLHSYDYKVASGRMKQKN